MFASVSGGAYGFFMEFDFNELVGVIAAFCTTTSFLPQVIQTWRSRSARDISLRMYMLFTFGTVLWLYYGVAIGSLAVVAANCATLILTVAMLVMKILFDRRSGE